MTRRTKRSLEKALEDLKDSDDDTDSLPPLTDRQREHLESVFEDADPPPEEPYDENGNLTGETKKHLADVFDVEPPT